MILENGRIYISKGTPFPFICPKCKGIVPVKSYDGLHGGVDRFDLKQTCNNCNYVGDTEEFDVEFEFKPVN